MKVMMIYCFCGMADCLVLTGKQHLALFPAGIIFRDPHISDHQHSTHRI